MWACSLFLSLGLHFTLQSRPKFYMICFPFLLCHWSVTSALQTEIEPASSNLLACRSAVHITHSLHAFLLQLCTKAAVKAKPVKETGLYSVFCVSVGKLIGNIILYLDLDMGFGMWVNHGTTICHRSFMMTVHEKVKERFFFPFSLLKHIYIKHICLKMIVSLFSSLLTI